MKKQLLAAGAMSAVLLTISSCSALTPTLNLEALASETTDFQRTIIADGFVTPAEYETALLARRDCVLASGATPGDIYEIALNERTFDFEITAPSVAAMNRIQEKADACIPEYFAEVGSVWAWQQLLTPAQLEELRPE